jgi:hypothetical protein
MHRLRMSSGALWLSLLLVPIFLRIALTWGVGAALVLTPATAVIARSVALVIAPQLARRAR